jgi:hypothetical protein
LYVQIRSVCSMRVRQSGGFLDVAPLAEVVLLLPAWPYRLLAFPAWTRFG